MIKIKNKKKLRYYKIKNRKTKGSRKIFIGIKLHAVITYAAISFDFPPAVFLREIFFNCRHARTILLQNPPHTALRVRDENVLLKYTIFYYKI